MKTIMVATDFSERSDRALRRATLLARQFEATMLLVHVVDDDQPRRIVDAERDEALTLLRQMAATLRDVDGVICDTRVVLADPFAGIARAVEEDMPDLLVIGPHRRQALRDVFIGTTAERTIRTVACPVLMANALPAAAYRRVMLATDLSEGAAHAAKCSVLRDIARDARVSFLHVYDAPAIHLAMSHTIPEDERAAYLDDQRKEASRALADFVAGVGWPSARRDVRQAGNSAADEILSAAGEGPADLVVIGTHGRRGLARFFLGSVAEAVLRGADRDVLAVPPARPA